MRTKPCLSLTDVKTMIAACEAEAAKNKWAVSISIVDDGGYPLADQLAARIQQARAEQDTGANPLGLMFPAPRGGYWRSSNFDRRVLAPAYQAAGWRDAAGNGTWTWHSLRHVFCTTALFCWHLEATDVSCMAGHANVRVTLDMYVGATAGVLDRARTATQ